MTVSPNYGNGITSIDVFSINLLEIQQMLQMRDRIAHVLNTHEGKDSKNEYLSDDDLRMMHAILTVFTRPMENSLESEFDKYLKLNLKAPQTPEDNF